MRRAFIDDDRLARCTGPGADLTTPLVLPERIAFRFARVLRLDNGADVEVFDAAGRAVRGHFAPPDRVVDLVAFAVDDGLPPLLVIQALTKTDKLELVTQKATELGCSRLVLWKSARSLVKLDDERGDKKVGRLQRVADDAARQSGRARPPVIEGPLRTAEVAALLRTFVDGGGIAVTGVVDADQHLSELLARERDALTAHGFAIIIGPEGGVSDDEEEAFAAVGARGVRFSRFVLRTETAALVALSLAQAGLGEA